MRIYKNRYQQILKEKGYSQGTIESYVKRLRLYEEWIQKEMKKERYKNLKNKEERNRWLAYNYVKYYKKKITNINTINREIQPLRLYGKLITKENYFKGFYVRGKQKTFNYPSLSEEELNELYETYPEKTYADKRNKVMLGFYIYQGIKSSELKAVLTDDIDLKKYTLQLRGNNRLNSRKLSLNMNQILLLQEYLLMIRTSFIKQDGLNKEELFLTGMGNTLTWNSTQVLANKLKKSNRNFISLNQLRTSVIRKWLKLYDVRKVQQMSGHKYISSTEKYIEEDLQELQSDVNKYFPEM